MALQPTQQNHLLNLFNYKDKQLRTIIDKRNNIYFSGKDSASILEYVNTRQASCELLQLLLYYLQFYS